MLVHWQYTSFDSTRGDRAFVFRLLCKQVAYQLSQSSNFLIGQRVKRHARSKLLDVLAKLSGELSSSDSRQGPVAMKDNILKIDLVRSRLAFALFAISATSLSASLSVPVSRYAFSQLMAPRTRSLFIRKNERFQIAKKISEPCTRKGYANFVFISRFAILNCSTGIQTSESAFS